MRFFFSAFVSVVCVGSLCGCQPQADIGTHTAASSVEDGVSLNGVNLNGVNLNGVNLNGVNLNGNGLGTSIAWVSLDRVRLVDTPLDDVTLTASVFAGTTRSRSGGGQQLSGLDFIGASFFGHSDTGRLVHLRIADIQPPQGSGDVWRYRVEYRQAPRHWRSICQNDNGDSFLAIPVNGWWNPREGVPGGGGKVTDPGKFTFACEDIGAIGKCIDIGYEPWASVDGVSLDAYHQSCVRLIRADYCGDGISYTTNGKLVNLYDDLGIQVDTENWNLEAEWSPDGARCLNSAAAQVHSASCYDQLVTADCGDPAHFGDGTLLISERP